MFQSQLRVKTNPLLSDTTGFFDLSVPLTNESFNSQKNSLNKYTDFSIYDYVTPSGLAIEQKQGPSLFVGHELGIKDFKLRPIDRTTTDWVTAIVIFCLFIIAWIQTNHSKRLRQIVRSVALPYYVNQLEREGNLYNERITLGLGFIFLNAISLLIFKLAEYFDSLPDKFPGFITYIFIFSGVFTFVIMKGTIVRITGSIFKTWDQAHAYRLNALIFNQMVGLILFPFTLIIYYWQSSPYIWITLGIIGILLIYRFVRSILIGFTNTKFSVFHLILYLCTLEILPLLLMVKFIRQI
jgi:hypothetical protein